MDEVNMLKNCANKLKLAWIILLLTTFFTLLFLPETLMAETASSTPAVHDYLTVEENIALMNKDNNGFADVYEIRAYLEKIHGDGYEKKELDFLVSTAKGKSCSTPFAKALY